MKKFLAVLVSIFLIAATLIGCGNSNSGKNVDHDKLSVYTSFYPMYDFARSIGGDNINLKNLIPTGVEPHDWEPTPKDIAEIQEADVFIYNGAGMEGWIDKLKESVKGSNVVFVEASHGIKLKEIDEDDEHNHVDGDDHSDPHVWLSLKNAKTQLKNIKDAFIEKDAKQAEIYEKNYSQTVSGIDELINEYNESVKQFKSKDIVVAHRAYGYLCDEYGLNQVAIEGISTDSEPTVNKMNEIIEFCKKNNVKYIFYDELINPKVAQTIANESNTKTALLNTFEGSKDENKTYTQVMRENLQALKSALE